MLIRVFDENGQVQTVEASAEVEAALRAGRLRLSSQNGSIGVRDANGDPFDVDAEHLNDWLAQGYRLETPDELRADHARLVAESRPNAGTVAFGQALGNELTWGLASADQSPHERRVAEATREQNPGASMLGTATGIIAPALLTGGGSVGARTGLRGLAALTPGGATALAGSAVERALIARFGQGAASRALATVGGAVTDGALSGVAAAFTQATIQGTPLEAEQVFSDALFGAALGLGGGALIAGGGAALRGAGRVLRGATDTAERATSYAERLVSHGLGEVPAPVASRAQRIAAWASGVDAQDLARIGRDPVRAFDAAGFTTAARETAESLGALRRQLDDAGTALSDATRRRAMLAQAASGIDGATAQATTRTALEAAQGRVRQAIAGLAPDARTAGARVLRGVGTDLDGAVARVGSASSPAEAIGELDRVIAAIDDASPRVGDTAAPVLAELRTALANVASDANVYGRAGALWGELDGARRALSEAREAFTLDGRRLAEVAQAGGDDAVALARRIDEADSLLATAERAGADVAPARAALAEARERVGRALEWGDLRAAAERGLEAEGGHGVRGVLTQAIGARGAKLAGGALGAVLGGAPGAAAGAGLGTLWDVVTHPVSAYRRLGALGDSVRSYTGRLDAGLARLERAIGSGFLDSAAPASAVRTASRVVIGLRGSPDERRAEYRQVSTEIRALATDPDALGARLGETLAPVGEASPQLADAMHTTAVRGVQYLAEHLPATDAPTLFSFTRVTEPSQWEIDKFLRRYEAVEDPLSILDRASEGSLHVEHREAVETVYPEVYSEIQSRVSEMLGAMDEPPPYQVRLQLGVLMGVPSDRSLTPDMIAALQSHYAQTSTQDAVIHGGDDFAPTRIDDSFSSAAASETASITRRLA